MATSKVLRARVINLGSLEKTLVFPFFQKVLGQLAPLGFRLGRVQKTS
jgi:hypothetical protein